MALFDVFVTQGELGWNDGGVSAVPAKEGALVLGVEAADAGTAAKLVSATVGQDVNEGWRVYPSGSVELVGSPTTAT